MNFTLIRFWIKGIKCFTLKASWDRYEFGFSTQVRDVSVSLNYIKLLRDKKELITSYFLSIFTLKLLFHVC